ncbi:hypothetical protein ONZ45_g1750 [Pleurotus djamor]|nr:hypothetical protein ONZ45_g1750 [Pleurotus djamor]
MKVSPHLPIKFVQSLKLIECADESTSYDQTFHVIRLDILNPFDKDFDANTLLDNHRMRGTSTSNYRCAYLHDAVYNGDVILACEMIRLGSKIDVLDSKGRTPLLLGTIRLANLARRATTDRPPSPSKGPYPRILTILRILIEHLADVSYIFNRRTPLHYACDARDWELVALLINHGANPSLRGTEPIIPSLNTTDTHRIQTLLQQHHRTKDNTPLTRPCPCFSGLSLNECHAKREHAYPGHHACPSGLGCQGLKPYISCCSPRRIQALESWDSEAQRIKTTVTKSIHPDPEEEMADHPMHDIRKKLTRYFSGGLPLDGSVVDIMRFFRMRQQDLPRGSQ